MQTDIRGENSGFGLPSEWTEPNDEAYDQNLSPVNFARDLVAAHRARWPDLYPDAENQ